MKNLSLTLIVACASICFSVQASDPRGEMLGVGSQSSGPISGGYRPRRVKPVVPAPEGATFSQRFWKAFKPIEEQPKREPYSLSDYPRGWVRTSLRNRVSPREANVSQVQLPRRPMAKTAEEAALQTQATIADLRAEREARLARKEWRERIPRAYEAYVAGATKPVAQPMPSMPAPEPMFTEAPQQFSTPVPTMQQPRFTAADEEALARAYGSDYVPPVNPPAHYFGPTTQQEFNQLPLLERAKLSWQSPWRPKQEAPTLTERAKQYAKLWGGKLYELVAPTSSYYWTEQPKLAKQYKGFKAEDVAAYQKQFEQLPIEERFALRKQEYEQLPRWKRAMAETPVEWLNRQPELKVPLTPEERKRNEEFLRSDEFYEKTGLRLTPEGTFELKGLRGPQLIPEEAADKLALQQQISALQRQFDQLPFEEQLDLKRKEYEKSDWFKKALTESPDAWKVRRINEMSKAMPTPTPEERKIRSEEFRKKARLTPEGYSEIEWWKIPQEG